MKPPRQERGTKPLYRGRYRERSRRLGEWLQLLIPTLYIAQRQRLDSHQVEAYDGNVNQSQGDGMDYPATKVEELADRLANYAKTNERIIKELQELCAQAQRNLEMIQAELEKPGE